MKDKTIRLTEGNLRVLIREFMAAALAGAGKRAKRKGAKGEEWAGGPGGEYIGQYAGQEQAEGWGDESALDEADDEEATDEGEY